MNQVAVCIPTRNDKREPGTLGFPLVCLALQTWKDFAVYIRDEGDNDAFATPYFRLILTLLANQNIRVNYWRTRQRRGAGFARQSLFSAVRDEPWVLWLDDDMIIAPDALARLVSFADSHPRAGFVQGGKIELDPLRTYHNDINQLNRVHEDPAPIRLWFGDTACLLARAEALRQIDWSVLTRYQLDGLTGEDVSMSLMIAAKYEGWGLPDVLGWHLSPATERWLWEPPSDALQVELLKEKVDVEILRRALPHLASSIIRLTTEDESDGVLS